MRTKSTPIHTFQKCTYYTLSNAGQSKTFLANELVDGACAKHWNYDQTKWILFHVFLLKKQFIYFPSEALSI